MFPILVALLTASEVPIPEQIVAFAHSRLGQKVGDGECSSLAVEALRHAGIRRRWGRGGIWGEEIPSLREVRPGDILQFENAVFVGQRALENGGLLTRTLTFPHHTAIVARVQRRGPRPILVILHQNVGAAGAAPDDPGRKVVQQATLNLAEKRRGSVRAYRPYPDDQPSGPSPGPPAAQAGASRSRSDRTARPAGSSEG